MMTAHVDMTNQLAAIPYGLAIALGVSAIGILANANPDGIRMARMFLLDAYHRVREVFALPTVARDAS